ncbi:asparagine synthase-related protein [Photorhabdus australis]
MVINATTIDIDTYINALFSAMTGIQIDSMKKMDHQWATMIEANIRLCDTERKLTGIEISTAHSSYSGWIRDLDSDLLISSFRQNAPILDPSQGRVVGEFSYISIQPDHVLAVTDHYATHPVYYWQGKNRQWVISNDLRMLLLFHHVPLNIRHESCFEFLTQSVMVGENELADGATFFTEIRKIPINSVLKINRTDGIFKLAPMNISAASQYGKTLSYHGNFQHAFRECFDTCVADRLKAGADGILLSGGIDSSTVLGASLALNENPPMFCANMSFRDADLAMSQDDKIVETLVHHCNLPHNIVYADDFLRLPAPNDPIAYIDGPEPSANPLAKEAFASVFQHNNVSLIMTGEGGDIILGESMHQWILDSIRIHDGIRELHKYITENLRVRPFSLDYFHRVLTSLSPYLGRRALIKEELDNQRLPDYFGAMLHNSMSQKAKLQKIKIMRSQAKYLGHDYIKTLLFPRATYFDSLNIYCTYSHPLLDPRMTAFTLSCPPHLNHDYKRLNLANPYPTSKMLARKAYSNILPNFVTDKQSKTSYALMARRMFYNSAKEMLRLTDRPMILDSWKYIDQAKFRRYLIAYIIATEDPNTQLGVEYHYLRGVIDLEAWLMKFTQERTSVINYLKFSPLRTFVN